MRCKLADRSQSEMLQSLSCCRMPEEQKQFSQYTRSDQATAGMTEESWFFPSAGKIFLSRPALGTIQHLGLLLQVLQVFKVSGQYILSPSHNGRQGRYFASPHTASVWQLQHWRQSTALHCELLAHLLRFREVPASDIGPGIVCSWLMFMVVMLSASMEISGQHLKVGYHHFRQHYIYMCVYICCIYFLICYYTGWFKMKRQCYWG
jgi:hypothetical protein